VKRWTRAWLFWLSMPEVVRVGLCIMALIVFGLIAGCARLQEPRLSADLVKMDEVTCETMRARLCIAQVWLYLKFKFD
jgi:hypothetical protein